MTKENYSCASLHHSIYFSPNELRHCCKRFYVKGKIKGDVKIIPVNKTSDISVESIRKAKQKLHNQINNGIENECSGCPYLVKDNWPSLDNLSVKHISFESHSVCNMKCSYCSETYYGGLKPNYDLEKILKIFKKSNVINKEISIVWGGGEPTLLNNFEKILTQYTNSLKPRTNHIFTNAVKYSNTIADFLKNNMAKITTSIDAGSIETFKKVRGVKTLNKVLYNLKKYYKHAGRGIIVKYILTDENYSMKELNLFLNKIKEYNLISCDFQISSDFKNEKLTKLQAINALKLHSGLIDLGVKHCFFDDHLRPRLKNILSNMKHNNDVQFDELYKKINKNIKSNIIIWGAGDTTRQMLKNSLFFDKQNLKINFIVDSDPSKHGSNIDNLQIKNPDEIKKYKSSVFIASTMFYSEIYDNLLLMKVPKNKILSSLFF